MPEKVDIGLNAKAYKKFWCYQKISNIIEYLVLFEIVIEFYEVKFYIFVGVLELEVGTDCNIMKRLDLCSF